MYKPNFNHVLVEIDDKDAKWGKSNDGSIASEVYREGKLLEVADTIYPHGDTAQLGGHDVEAISKVLERIVGKQIMWNEGHEAGTVFEEKGKKYCLIHWWDIIGVKE